MTNSDVKSKQYAKEVIELLNFISPIVMTPDVFRIAIELAYKSGFVWGEFEIMASYHGITEKDDDSIRPN